MSQHINIRLPERLYERMRDEMTMRGIETNTACITMAIEHWLEGASDGEDVKMLMLDVHKKLDTITRLNQLSLTNLLLSYAQTKADPEINGDARFELIAQIMQQVLHGLLPKLLEKLIDEAPDDFLGKSSSS